MSANTVPDGGGITTLGTTNKAGRGDKVTPINNKTGHDGGGIATPSQQKDLRG